MFDASIAVGFLTGNVASMSLLKDRLKSLRGKRSQAEFAAEIGVSLATYSRYERGENTPDAEALMKIHEATNADISWLLMGNASGASRRGGWEEAAQAGAFEEVVKAVRPQTIDAPDHEIVLVPMVEARLSAGHGSFETQGAGERQYSFRSDFLCRKGQIDKMVLMRVEGDSMAPEIRGNDVVLIDQSQTQPMAGNVYAVGIEDLVYLKMIDAAPGKLVLSSYNPAYESFEIDTRGDLEARVRIIGRVVWSCREW